jgi:hypothetical protein
MTLIVINDPKIRLESQKVQKAYLKSIGLHLEGKTNLVAPENIDDFAKKVQEYRPTVKKRADNIVILGSLDDFFDSDEVDIGYYRFHDLYINHKGGVIVGEKPTYNSGAYLPNVDPIKDIDYIISVAKYNENLSRAYNLKSSIDYTGRGNGFPRAIICGFGLDYPRISMGGLTILGGLPEYENFWYSVGWFRTRSNERDRKKLRKLTLETYPDAARIAITETADRIMTEEGIRHVYIEGRPGKANNFTARKKYGSLIYEKMLEYFEEE